MPSQLLRPGSLTLPDLRRIWSERLTLALDPDAKPAVDAAAATVAQVISEGRTVYGVNTGFGLLARTRIDSARLSELQRALVRSHSAGTGALLDDAVVRLIIALKVASLGRGHSGVRWEVIELLTNLANVGIVPCIPGQGSVGASGDLAPLAHLSAVLIGEGEARIHGDVVPGAQALALAGLRPIELAPKEGLALLNGTQVSTALALAGLFAAERAMFAAFVAGAMTVDAVSAAIRRSMLAFSRARSSRTDRRGGNRTGTCCAGSAIRASHVDCSRVQDPYSLRCQPQVMGACLDQWRQAARCCTEAERRLRQSAGVRGHRRGSVRRQFPRRSRGVRGGQSGPGDRRNGFAVRAPHRAAHGREPFGFAAVPGQGRRTEFRVHDRAGHGRRTGLREQVARASGQSVDSFPHLPIRRTTSAWRPSQRDA